MSDLALLAPELALAAGVLVTLALSAFARKAVATAAFVALVCAGALVVLGVGGEGTAFGALTVGPRECLFDGIIIVSSALALVVLVQNGGEAVERYILLLAATVGATLLVKSHDLITAIFALELLSFPLYILVALPATKRSVEGATKYFVLGALSSGTLLMGAALVYVLTGSVKFADLLAAPSSPLLVVAFVFLLVGLGFKVSAAPFHFWTPDVVLGADTGVGALVATTSKTAAFALLFAVTAGVFAGRSHLINLTVSVLAVVTMCVGNFAALRERSVKRMLGYSTIAHAGYALVALRVGGAWGLATLVFYLAAYALMTAGAFAFVSLVSEERAASADEGTGYRGLARRSPLVAALGAVLLLSLAGVPPTAGFVAKFFLVSGAVKGGMIPLAVVVFANGVVSAYYYLRVAVLMYFNKPVEPVEPLPRPRAGAFVAAVCAASVLALGVFPAPLMELLRTLF